MKIVIPLSKIDANIGQIDGLPANPRFIKDAKFDMLVASIKEDPELLEHRGVLVFPYKDKYVAIGGNQRLEACKKAGLQDVTCEVIDASTPIEHIKRYVIKDNSSFGEWDFAMIENSDWLDFIIDNSNLGIDLPCDIDPSIIKEDKPEREKSVLMDYTIFFDTQKEQDLFYSFLAKLRNRFAGTPNVSQRILRWIAALYEENGELSDSKLLLKLIGEDMCHPDEIEKINYNNFKEDGI